MTNTQQGSASFPWARMIASSILGISKTGLLVIALVAALALNVATLTIDSAFKMMSSAIGAVAGLMTSKPATVLDKHRREITSWKNKVHVQKNYSAALRNQISAAEKHMDLLDNQNTKLQRKLKTPATVIFKGKQRLLSGPSGKFCNIQSHCASANQGAFRRQWPLPWQETQHRVALAQRLPKGRARQSAGYWGRPRGYSNSIPAGPALMTGIPSISPC